MSHKKWTTLVSLAVCLLAAESGAAEPLTLGFLTRPGFADLQNGRPVGAFLSLAGDAVEKSGLPEVKWEPLPQKRMIDRVREGKESICAVGIYKTEERLAFAKFSNPFYRDRPFTIVTSSAKSALVKKHASFSDLVADQELSLTAIDGFSYGAYVDDIIKQAKNVSRKAVTVTNLYGMMSADRIDYFIGDPEEYDTNLELNGIRNDALVAIEFPDFKEGALRHFMCSKAVDDQVIQKLNAGISASQPGRAF